MDADSVTDSVTVLVGPKGKPFVLSKRVLQFSEYFSTLLSDRWAIKNRIMEENGKNEENVKSRENIKIEENVKNEEKFVRIEKKKLKLEEKVRMGKNIRMEKNNAEASCVSNKNVVVTLDFDEKTFERVVHVLRYKQFQTVPTSYITDEEISALQNQLEYLGIEFDESDLANSGINSNSFTSSGDPTFAFEFSLANRYFVGELLCKHAWEAAKINFLANLPYGIIRNTGVCPCENTLQERNSRQAAKIWEVALKDFDSQEKNHYEKITNLVESKKINWTSLSSISSLLITVFTPEIECFHKESCPSKLKKGTKWAVSFRFCLAWCIFCSKEPDYRKNIMPKILGKGLKVAKKQLEFVLELRKQQKS